MEKLINPTVKNPRGIPQAPFIEKITDFIKQDTDFDNVMMFLQERLQQYKFMEQSKKNSILNFEKKIPEIQESLTTCKYLKEQNDEVDSDPIEINYELNDTLFTTAELPPKTENVLLWLGADIMLEYPIEEAIELLSTKLTTAKENLKISKEDCEFLRENITTMEVNTARLYNWDVEKRKKERLTEQTKNLKINSSNSD